MGVGDSFVFFLLKACQQKSEYWRPLLTKGLLVTPISFFFDFQSYCGGSPIVQCSRSSQRSNNVFSMIVASKTEHRLVIKNGLRFPSIVI